MMGILTSEDHAQRAAANKAKTTLNAETAVIIYLNQSNKSGHLALNSWRSKRMRKFNVVFHVAAFSTALASLVLFVVGMFAASDKITHLLVNKGRAQLF